MILVNKQCNGQELSITEDLEPNNWLHIKVCIILFQSYVTLLIKN